MKPATLIRAPQTAPAFLALSETRYLAWDAAQPAHTCTVLAVNRYNAERSGAMVLRVPQWRVRVRPEPIAIHDSQLTSLGIA